jgi:RNA polymerase sigma-70 factor, Bacteroides expansion family 1
MDPKRSFYIQEMINDNKEVYTQLFKNYYKGLCAYSFKIVKDISVAEEVVQNVFFRIWEKRKTLNLDENIDKYLYRAVYNESIDACRRINSENNFKQAFMLQSSPDAESKYDALGSKELAAKLQTAINKLPERSKEVFLLSRYSALTYKEIGEKLGISPKGVEFHMIKALKILRTELWEYRYAIVGGFIAATQLF